MEPSAKSLHTGRPSGYQPEFCDVVIQLGKEGQSLAQIAAVLDVAIITVRDWVKKHPDFAIAMSRARDLSLAWWEAEGQRNLTTSSEVRFDARLWAINMFNRFPEVWRDRRTVELTGADGGPIELASVDQIRAELERRGRRASIDVSAFTDVEVIPDKKLLNQPDDSTTKPKDEK